VKAPRAAARSIAMLLCVSLMPLAAAPVRAAGGEPVLRLIATKSRASAFRHGKRAAWLEPALLVGATEGTLDLRIRRSSFADPLSLTQVVHSPGGATARALPADLLDGWRGLTDFFRLTVTDAEGRTVWTDLKRFCPNNWDSQRLDDRGPNVATFPSGCYRSRRLLGMAWGIDKSWAVPTRAIRLPVPDGTYSVGIEITGRYRELFGIAPEDAAVELTVDVKTVSCRHCERAVPLRAPNQADTPEEGVPHMPDPDPSVLPDLRSLPAFNMRVRNARNGKSFLRFAATVWVAGDAPIVVEGFRRSDEAVMDAYQYFYRDGKPVGRAPAGTFEYDERDGHLHWHVLQFVRYNMLTSDQSEVVRSKKEAFCLVPTDAVDLSLDNAARTESSGNLNTSCGGPGAMWIRETIPLGWGDTYYQGIPGQAFDITDLPNGTYFVEVAANPEGLLYEQDTTNNVELRKVILRGTAGDRRVKVPDPYGIDG
jgi:hypothetical protein